MSRTPDKKHGKPSGLEEGPQAPFEGAPFQGSVSDWVRDLERAAEKEARKAETRDIRSKAGTHRAKIERQTRAETPVDPNDEIRAAAIKTATGGDAKARAKAGGTAGVSAKSSRGTSIGASSDPRI
ncbi:MAG: excinuclease ABC subunit UvrB, partial [Rhizobiaceae bacterium]